MRTALIALMLSAALVFAAEPAGKVEIDGKVIVCKSCKGTGWSWTVGTNRHKPDEPRVVCQQCNGEGKQIQQERGNTIQLHTAAGEVLRKTILVEQLAREVKFAEERFVSAQAALEKGKTALEAAKAAAGKPADLPAEKL